MAQRNCQQIPNIRWGLGILRRKSEFFLGCLFQCKCFQKASATLVCLCMAQATPPPFRLGLGSVEPVISVDTGCCVLIQYYTVLHSITQYLLSANTCWCYSVSIALAVASYWFSISISLEGTYRIFNNCQKHMLLFDLSRMETHRRRCGCTNVLHTYFI